jgi:hypothetical protein
MPFARCMGQYRGRGGGGAKHTKKGAALVLGRHMHNLDAEVPRYSPLMPQTAHPVASECRSKEGLCRGRVKTGRAKATSVFV